MSKELGIKINVDYSEIDKLSKALAQKVEKLDIDLDTSKADAKHKNFAKQLNSLKSTLNNSLKLNIDTNSALRKIKAIEESYKQLKQSMSEGLNLDLQFGNNLEKTFGKVVEQANKTKQETDETLNSIGKNMSEANGLYNKVKQATGSGATDASKGMKEMSNEIKEASSEADKLNDSINKMTHINVGNQGSLLKEIVGYMKEIESLNHQKVSSNDESVNLALENRIRLTQEAMSVSKELYEANYGKGSLQGEATYELQKAQTALNQELRRASEEKEAQLQLDKQAKDQLTEYVKLENELSKTIQNADKADSKGNTNEASVLREKATLLDQQAQALKNNVQLETQYGQEVRTTMEALRANNIVQEQFNSQALAAKTADKANMESQKANYNELKQSLQEVHKIRMQIAQLEVKESGDNANITGKESIKLESLRQQKALIEANIVAKEKDAVTEGKITQAQQDSLNALKQTQSAKESSAANTAKIANEAQKVTQEYDKWAQSINKVGQLSKQLSTAGDEEASKIRELIQAEKEYQQTIEKTINSMNGRNEVRTQELVTQQKLTDEAVQASEEMRIARGNDGYKSALATSGILGDFFNPRQIINEGKQAAMAIYRSVKEIDDQIVNIAKVVDAPKAELDAFADGIYDAASKVGRGAAEYAISVERWASSGKSLKDSIEFAEYSSMGAFVGNVDEAAMVDYMSVPLLAYTKAGLEAKDVINAMNEVANNNAIEMGDLGAAYQKAAGTAANAGTTFSQLTGMISGAQEVTRVGGEQIGTAFKSIDLNFVKMASRITKEDNRKMDFFKDLGVDVVDANGQLNSTYDILDQLSQAWGNLDDSTRGEAVLNLAGKYHSNIATSMLENWGLVEKAAAEAQGQVNLVGEMKEIDGSAFNEFAIQQDSLEFKTQALKNAWAEFLNTVSGGKDVIKGVMDGLIAGVEKLTSLAKNPLIRTLMTGAVGVAGLGVSITSTNALWNIMKKGLSGVISPFQKANYEAQGLTETVGTLTTVAGKTGKFGNITKGLGAIGSFSMKAVPYIGGVVAALEVLKLFDIDVMGWLKDFVGFGEAKESVDEFIEKSDELKKRMSENVIFNGKIVGAQETIDNLQEIIDKKLELDEADGTDILRNLSFSQEEFTQIQTQYNTLIEELGLSEDLLITWNNFEDIKQKIEEIQKAKDVLLNGSVKDLIDDMNEAGQAPQKEVDSIVRKKGGDFNRTINSEEFKNLNETYDENLSYYRQAQAQLRANLKQLDAESTKDAFNSLTTKDARMSMLTEIAREVSLREKAKDSRDGVLNQLGESLQYWDDWSGGSEANKDQYVIQSKEMLDYINSLGGEFANLGAEIYAWGEAGLGSDHESSGYQVTERLLAAIKADVKNFDATTAEYEDLFKTLGKDLMGLQDDQLEQIKNSAESSGIDLIDALFNFGDYGQAALGMGLEWNALASSLGMEVSELAKSVQGQVDALGLDNQVKLQLGITMDEEGTVNFEAIEQVLGLDQELVSHFKLVDESGPNIENIVGFLDQLAGNEELMQEVGIVADIETGQIDLERFLDFWNGLGEDGQKDFVASVTTELEEPDTPIVQTITGEVEIGEIPKDMLVAEVTVGMETEPALIGLNNLIAAYNAFPTPQGLIEIQQIVDNLKANGIEVDIKVKNGVTGELEPIQVPAEVTEIDVVAKNPKVDVEFSSGGLQGALDEASAGAIVKVPMEFTGGRKGPEAPEAQTQTIIVDADTSSADTKIATVGAGLDALTSTRKDALIGANDAFFRTVAATVDSRVMKSKTVYIRGDSSHFDSIMSSIKSSSVTVNIKGKASSQVVMAPQLGASFSTSVGQALSNAQFASVSGRSMSTKADESKVSEDVWRYWAKELFTGLPLERTMESLTREIKKADKNQDKLIDLYGKQIEVVNKQLAYQSDLQKAQTQEAKDLIGKLSKYGFQNDGIRITNLDRAKSLTGDQATEADKLLGQWKKIYESISSIDKTIAELNLDKYELEDDIRDAKIAKELERIESAIKASSALLLAIEQNTDIQSKREDMVNGSDFELSMAVQEQGLNSSSRNIKTLLDEFNRLSQTGVEFSENAEEMQDQLDDLKDSILENADAVIEYREALNELRIERFTGDYDKFMSSLNTNLERLSTNIDTVREGLVSGTDISSLASSKFARFDLTRRSKFEQEQEQRLKLEAELNRALDDYAKINVDRTAKASEKILKIEANKYEQLLKMANAYSNGEAVSISAQSGKYDIGFTEISKSQDKQYVDWQNRLKAVSDTYMQEYSRLMKNYDNMSKSKMTGLERQALNNQFILDQLKLQESMNQQIIKTNTEAVAIAEKELENTSLTTEQRETLLDAIRDYEDANVDAQAKIRDSITARFELEFDMLDKMMANITSYTSELEYMLEVAELIGSSADVKQGIFDSLFASKVNQYTSAKSQLQQLIAEQAKFTEYSLEWNLLDEKIKDVKESMKGFGKDTLNANKAILENMLEDIRDTFEKGLLKGKTLDQWEDYTKQWISGLTKEIELDNLRQKLIDNENDLIKNRLEALDRQEEVSKKDVEYLDKQLAVIELENKLNGIGQENNISYISRRDDGTFGMSYTYDKSEYDKTKKELNDARKELEEFMQDQRGEYAKDLGSIIDGVESGSYSSVADLEKALTNLNAVYGLVLEDIPDLSNLSGSQLIAAYEKYLSTNALIGGELLGNGGSKGGETLSNIGSQFEKSFLNVSEQLGQIIGNEIRKVVSSSENQALGGVYHIAQLSFPNVTDPTGFQDVLETLNQTASQYVGRKN